MMKKIFYRTCTALQILFLITANGIQYFSMRKMGMMRYVVYINHKWEEQYPITSLQYVAIALLVVLAIIYFVVYVKIKKNNYVLRRMSLLMLIFQGILTLLFVFFTLTYSTASYRSYYFMSLILAFIALIQAVKILVYFKR